MKLANKNFIGSTYQHVYAEIIREIIEKYEFKASSKGQAFYEITGLSFEIIGSTHESLESHVVNLTKRNFNLEFAKKFFDWIMSGETDISKLYDSNKNARNFNIRTGLPDSFSTAYGPRIQRQLPKVIQLLNDDPGSRQAFIHILEEGDKILYDAPKAKVEYPCTIGLQFLIRESKEFGKVLDMHVLMRSNNMLLTVCYDVYNFFNLLKYTAKELNINPGAYRHHSVSAHIFEKDLDLAKSILSEYDDIIKKDIEKHDKLSKT